MTIRRLSGPEFALIAPELVDIYIAAMGYDPAIRMQRIAVWRREILWPGFTAVVAVEKGYEGDEALRGLAYGFIGDRKRWWDQQLIRGLRQRGGPTPLQREILRDYFEVAEVHVAPRAQGRGLGRAMLTELLRNAPASWALLSTPEVPGEDNAAFGLYRSFGFTDILRDFYYAGDPRPFAVLGLRLPAPASR